MDTIKNAISRFHERDNCAQAILATYGPKFGLDEKLCLKLTEVFSGGMAHTGNICGAVTGAFLVIGLRFSDLKVENQEAMHQKAKEFIKQFEARNNSIICGTLLNFVLTTIERRKQASEENIFVKCPRFVQDAAEILEEMI